MTKISRRSLMKGAGAVTLASLATPVLAEDKARGVVGGAASAVGATAAAPRTDAFGISPETRALSKAQAGR